MFNKSAALAKSSILLFTFSLMFVCDAKADEQTNFFVVPTQPWDDTGISLTTGETLVITATGEMDYNTNNTCPVGESCTVGPDGSDPGGTCIGYPVTAPSLPCNSLIGKIGVSGSPFEVGTSLNLVPNSGELYLGVNDSYFPDNTLGWTATISVSATPEPASGWLMAMIGAGLVLWGRKRRLREL